MIPFGAIAAAIVIASRIAGGGGIPVGPAPDGPMRRFHERPIPAWFWALLVNAVALSVLYNLLGTPWALSAAVFLFPWFLARRVAYLGLAGPARILGRLALYTFSEDLKGGALLASALALAHRRTHDDKLAARIVEDLDEVPPPIRGASIAALGLVAASAGRAEEARDFFRSIGHFEKKITPRVARAIATEWLVADAARAGDWAEVGRLAQARGPRSALVHFAGFAARRFEGGSRAPGDLALKIAWLLTPRHAKTRVLLQRALASPRRRLQASMGRPRPEETPLARATSLHVSMLALPREALSAPGLNELGAAWDEALGSPSTARDLLARELALGADGKSDTIRRLAARASADLAWLIDRSRRPLGDLGENGIIRAAATSVRDALLADLQAQAEPIHARGDERYAFETPEEWRAIARLREAHQEAFARLGEDGRRMAWEIVSPALSAIAVHLFNDLGEKSIANAVFAYLAQQAAAMGDAEGEATNSKNYRCGW